MTREEIENYVWNFLKGKNLADEVCAEIMGNIEAESEFNPSLVEQGNAIGFGLCQWSYERRTQLENYGTDLEHQLNFLWAELTGGDISIGAENQWIPTKGYTYDKFINNQYSIEEGTKAFCWCWERPNESLAHIDRRVNSANTYYNRYKGTGGGSEPVDENAEKIENAVQWMINIANDESHGYDQEYRWGERGDYDCSSLVISGYEQAGILLKSNGATYTGNMKSVALSLGFKEISISDWNNTTQFKRGDIILNEQHHVCCYIGNGQIVQASINELGTTTGGQTGDQTGKEILVRDYYIYSKGWDCVLRLGNGSSGGGSGSGGNDKITDDNYLEYFEQYFDEFEELGEVYKKICATPLILKQYTTEQIDFLKTLFFNDSCHIKHSFKKNKMSYGYDFCGKRLKIENKSYIIEDVENNGYVKFSDNGSICYKYVQPLYIYQNAEEQEQTKQEIIQFLKDNIKVEEEEEEEEENDN